MNLHETTHHLLADGDVFLLGFLKNKLVFLGFTTVLKTSARLTGHYQMSCFAAALKQVAQTFAIALFCLHFVMDLRAGTNFGAVTLAHRFGTLPLRVRNAVVLNDLLLVHPHEATRGDGPLAIAEIQPTSIGVSHRLGVEIRAFGDVAHTQLLIFHLFEAGEGGDFNHIAQHAFEAGTRNGQGIVWAAVKMDFTSLVLRRFVLFATHTQRRGVVNLNVQFARNAIAERAVVADLIGPIGKHYQ